ncbi:MipA/OmpV family protein [Stenotrophomonas sp. ISL-67]|uniref:MipA/OmpV family protein n=1 Tax=Stenotrophomonas sp. ISL-67 TaxID=2819171 RepID=UPI001BEB63BF|nr:MipA/OmpV family protein [Stenotrophomonas sp. ISL-67]MBT2767803.1 MipA/OmpV family protein [Stenotrophomonas sp. ISL-67]
MFRYLLSVPLLFPTLALAQSTTSTGDLLAKTNDDRWSIGVAASVRQSPYAGEGTRVRPVPLLTYEGNRLFWRGLGGGVHLVEGETFSLDGVLSGRFDGVDIKDLGRRELRANGVDPALLDDRDDGLDAGVTASWSSRVGEFKLSALADVTDASGGYEIGADYAYALKWGRTTVIPSIGVRWMSDDLVNYYHGTLDAEVARGVARYQPGSAVVPQVSIAFSRPLGEKWRVMGGVDYRFLPDEISESPLSEPDMDGSTGLRIGITRSF